MRFGPATLLILASVPAALVAQSLEQRVARVGNGTVHLSFAARSGVCGSGTGINIRDEESDWEHDCGEQQVRVALGVTDRRVASIRTYVGGRWRSG